MKEKKRIGHDDRINIQAAIAKGWTLLTAIRGKMFCPRFPAWLELVCQVLPTHQHFHGDWEERLQPFRGGLDS